MNLPRRTAIIPARGGSVRIPNKNRKLFFGKPIICYSIETARASGLFNLILVSTDDDEIEQIALASGAVVVRRPADDGSTGTQEVARRVLLNLPRADFACVIYATSPLLQPRDLHGGMRALQSARFAMSVGPDGQDAGCFYFGDVPAFLESLPLDAPHTFRVPLPAERVCDINFPSDWARAESLYDALRRAI